MQNQGKAESPVIDPAANSVQDAQRRALEIAGSAAYKRFVADLQQRFPWRFEKISREALERDYLRIVDHHLVHLLPRIDRYIGQDTRRVLDFGCGSGGSAIALAMVFPNMHCCGTDIDADEIEIARQRAALYGVADRCEFHHVAPSQPLPFHNGSFDFCLCSSVLEYATEKPVRAFCIQEMARLIRPQGLLFVSVPNRLYPFEIHTSKWGWNYFPRALRARIVDCGFWEIRNLARPAKLKLHRTPMLQLLRPWSSLCYQKEGAL